MPNTLTNVAKINYKSGGKNREKSGTSTLDLIQDETTIQKTQTPNVGFQGDIVEFTVTITVDSPITNAILTDDLNAAGYTFITGSVIIDGVSQPTENPVTGINLGNLSNTTKVIKFNGAIN